MPVRSQIAAALAGLVLLTGCAVRSGTPESEGSWQRKAEQAVGTAVSSLGSTALVLENQASGRLTRSFAVIAVRDALQILSAEAASFVTVQPPSGAAGPNRRAVRVIADALTVLNAAAIACADGGPGERRRVLGEVRDAYRDAQRFADRLAGSGG